MPEKRVAAVIPAFGSAELTRSVESDLLREAGLVDVWIVDNAGDYRSGGRVEILRPGENLGWVRGTNAGLAAAADAGRYSAYLLLNNDVRLFPGFVAGLLAAQRESGAGLVSPCYDGFWAHQQIARASTPGAWRARPLTWPVPFIDGTAMLLTARAWDSVRRSGADPLDEAFAEHGWGAEFDLSFRVADRGLPVVVTERAYLRHRSEATALAVHGPGYRQAAERTMRALLSERYGERWEARARIDPVGRNTPPPGRLERLAGTARLRLRARQSGAGFHP